MVNFNWIDRFFGEKPKRFQKEANKQIKDNTLLYMQKFGRGKWVTVSDIFEGTLEHTDLFNSKEGKMFFALGGIKGKINSVTNILRNEGYPIISGTSLNGGRYGKGYRYADESCDDFIDVWDEKFNAWEKRKSNLSKEKETDRILIKRIIERLIKNKREKEAEKLQEVLIKYGN